MADSLCGPSNALQNFQKHSTIDRTLQQDRLISRPSPSQGFRSPGPNVGALDPEFQAFQAGNFPLESQHGFHLPPIAHPSQNIQPGIEGTWTSDFQRLQLSSQQPILGQPAHQSHQAPSLQSSGGWAQDFQQMQGGQRAMSPPQMNGYSGYQSFQGPAMMHQYGGPMMSGGIASGSNMSTYQAPETLVEPAFDDAAFAKAFDDAFANAALADQEQSSTQEQAQTTEVPITGPQDHVDIDKEQGEDLAELDSMRMALAIDPMASDIADLVVDETIDRGLINQAPIGADIIHDPTDKTYPQPEQENHAELARTAGHLLDVVSERDNDKFANSQFMQLMRQLRDREVEVAASGRDMVNTKTGEKIGEDSEGIQIQV